MEYEVVNRWTIVVVAPNRGAFLAAVQADGLGTALECLRNRLDLRRGRLNSMVGHKERDERRLPYRLPQILRGSKARSLHGPTLSNATKKMKSVNRWRLKTRGAPYLDAGAHVSCEKRRAVQLGHGKKTATQEEISTISA